MIITTAARRGGLAPFIGILAMVVVLVLVRSPVRAAPNELSNGMVSPPAGTSDTVFTFTVDYVGTTPRSVSASAGGVTVPLSVIGGTPADGTYSGTGQLPAGTHSVVFAAITAQGNDPVLNGPQVVVSPGSSPTPSPSPTPTPTQIPTPAPTPTPPPTPTSTPTPVATPTPSQRPTRSPTPTPTVPAQSSAATPEQSVLAGTPSSPSAQPPAGPTAGESGPVATGEVGGVAASTAASPGNDPGPGSVDRTEGAALITPALATAAILSLIVILGVVHDRRRRAATSTRPPDRTR